MTKHDMHRAHGQAKVADETNSLNEILDELRYEGAYVYRASLAAELEYAHRGWVTLKLRGMEHTLSVKHVKMIIAGHQHGAIIG